MLPAVSCCNPSMHSSVVVFPAPFGPKIPKTSPSRTSNEMPSTAVRPPNVLMRPRTAMARAWSVRCSMAAGRLP